MDADNYFDLGNHSRKISTKSLQAQTWFDRGLNWLYGFNQEESVTCFRNAATADPNCAIAYWGLAYASGPFYNMPWEMFSAREEAEMLSYCHTQLQCALAKLDHASEAERALITALTKRFQSDTPRSLEIYRGWDDDFANAMRQVYRKFPDDLDVVALFAEAIMTRTPWQLWDLHSGEVVPGSDTLEAIEVLEKAIDSINDKNLPVHPGIYHLHIHVWEMSGKPESALLTADRLHSTQPDGGHLNHMPAHIYALCGKYSDALAVSEKAIIADRKFLAYAGPYLFYTTAICHDLHMKMLAAMMMGMYQPAIDAANEITEIVSGDVLSIDKPYMVMTLESYYSMKMHVLVRFGMWQKILDEPLVDDPQLYCVTTAMIHYAKGIANASLKNIDAARASLGEFENARHAIPEGRYFFNNPAHNILSVAHEMLNGELNYHMGAYDQAFRHLREAVRINDNLNYSEPWPWMHPPRHALGALLLEQGHVDEAEHTYRADLGLDGIVIRPAQHPDNVWSLHGFYECLIKSGKYSEAELVKQRLDIALARCDVAINASCCCRGSQKVA